MTFNILRLVQALVLQAVLSSALPAATTTAPGGGPLASCAASLDGKLPSPTATDFQFSGNVRTYYIAAEEVEWNYAPSGWDNWLGLPIKRSPRAKSSGYLTYGTTWLKALYRGYTDSSFSTLSTQPPWQGSQGPTLRSEVGDLIQIMFVNKLSKNYASMHSMGLAYTKYSEGSDYPNNTAPGQNVVLPPTEAVPPSVAPGDCVVYKWMVDNGSGPSDGLPAQVHSYHSYVTLQQDADAGLIGPSIVYASGKMNSTMASYREFTLLYNMNNEADSWLSGENAAKLKRKRDADEVSDPEWEEYINVKRQTANNETVWKPQETNLNGSHKFSGAPVWYNMNGFVYANGGKFEMCLNDNVIWYVNAYGTGSHVFHMHGNSFQYQGFNEYAESVNDGVGKTLYMEATGQGQWQVICHVEDHHFAGMEMNYEVYPTASCPLKALSS